MLIWFCIHITFSLVCFVFLEKYPNFFLIEVYGDDLCVVVNMVQLNQNQIKMFLDWTAFAALGWFDFVFFYFLIYSNTNHLVNNS